MDAGWTQQMVALPVRHLWALRNALRDALRDCVGGGLDVLDFQRIEPLLLFRRDPQPKNLLLHQDMSVARDHNSDIMWRHSPGTYEFFERLRLRATDRVCCARQTAVDRYRQTYPEVDERIQFIPTWVDTDVFRALPTRTRRTAGRTATDFPSPPMSGC